LGFDWTNGVQAALMAEHPLPQAKAGTGK